MNKKRVVITGIGAINALANNVNDTWRKLINGESGIALITKLDTTELSSKIAAEIKDYDPLNYFEPKSVKKLDLYTQYALIAGRQAMEDCGILNTQYDANRFGVILGAGIGGIQTFEEEANKMFTAGPRRISPFFIPKMISNIAAAQLSIDYRLKGVNYTCVSACASANHAMGAAFRAIQYGDADMIVTGGSEAAVTPLSLGGFCSMKALSTRNDEPHRACRPFDKERDGFIMGEGAALLIMEELEHALKRNAKIYAEVIGFGASSDAYHITAPEENGGGTVLAIENALNDAGLKPEEVDFVSAHGTSTPLNDKTETIAIKTVFGEHAYKLKINSTKSMLGHTLGAAAGIEAISCIMSFQTGVIHPTINYEFPDPDCDLDYVPNKAINHTVNVAISNSLGFGGHNSVLVLKRY
ncbi:MAG: beta-ketoacyl-ACP synthase II [Candidatus Cloacimonetes bacterium]|nr:beta-ketoacyl-ACP synthase II [Candidatus Cloacimonadota bacterium]